MSIPATEAVTSSGMYQSPTTATSGSADKEMFLNLMVAQLRYQDPMNPTDSGQFMAQNAQFTALEKMQDVADQTAALLNAQVAFGAAGMVGKTVTYQNADGSTGTGLVGSVSFDANGPALQVNGTSISLGQVQSLSTTSTPASTPTGTTTGTTTGSTAGTSSSSSSTAPTTAG